MRAFGEFLNRISQDIEKIDHTRQRLTVEYDSLVGLISAIKVSRELNFLRRMRLKRLLRTSEDLAVQIGRLNKVHQLQLDLLQSRIVPGITLLEREIEESIGAYERSPADSIRYQILEMLRDRSRMLTMLHSTWATPNMRSNALPVDGEPDVKANFALDLSDRLNARLSAIDFERRRVQFAIRLRNAYFRVAEKIRLPGWSTVRGWVEPLLTDRRLEATGLVLRSNEDLLVRDYKLHAERMAIQEMRQRWLTRAHEWQLAFEKEARQDGLEQ